MERIDEALARALMLLAQEDEPLAAQLGSYFKEQERRDTERAAATYRARHDLGNSLSIAQASIEAMLDGVVEISEERLQRVREILSAASVLLDQMQKP